MKYMNKPLHAGLCLLLCTLLLAMSACNNDDDTPNLPATPPAGTLVVDAAVGGATQPNQVYIDLSDESATVVPRQSWDLGFSNESGFYVRLNPSVGMLAMALDKNDMNQVSAADTTGLSSQLDINAIFGALFGPPPPWLFQASSWIDAPDGNLANTAMGAIAANDADNPVFIINRGNQPSGAPRGWMKIRVLQNGNGYELQYATIDATDFNSLNITKNELNNFEFVNLDQGTVSVEPAKAEWDFAFSTFTNLLPIDQTTAIPYNFQDFVVINSSGFEVAQVMVADGPSFEAFAFADASGLTFSSSQNAIGSSWRTVAQPGSEAETGVNTDRYYVMRDAAGFLYKLQFTGMLNPLTGERGHPQISYSYIPETE